MQSTTSLRSPQRTSNQPRPLGRNSGAILSRAWARWRGSLWSFCTVTTCCPSRRSHTLARRCPQNMQCWPSPRTPMKVPTITDQEFTQFQVFVYREAGIHLSPAKKPLVAGRLLKRLNHYQLARYSDYFRLLMHGDDRTELQMALDL